MYIVHADIRIPAQPKLPAETWFEKQDLGLQLNPEQASLARQISPCYDLVQANNTLTLSCCSKVRYKLLRTGVGLNLTPKWWLYSWICYLIYVVDKIAYQDRGELFWEGCLFCPWGEFSQKPSLRYFDCSGDQIMVFPWKAIYAWQHWNLPGKASSHSAKQKWSQQGGCIHIFTTTKRKVVQVLICQIAIPSLWSRCTVVHSMTLRINY